MPQSISAYWYDGTTAQLLYGQPADTTPPEPGRPPEGTIDPNTGVAYVAYETLYRPGDASVTETLNRATSPCVVTFPEGEWTITDFAARTPGGLDTGAGINLNKDIIRGIWGSGRGTLGGNTGTRFRMLPNTSTKGGTSWTPTQAQGGITETKLMRSVGCTGGVTLKNFQIVGSVQGESVVTGGHNFAGIQIYNPAGPVLVEDILVAGWQGNNGAPPGETFGLSCYTPGKIVPVAFRRIEADGRRSVGGERFGAGGFTLGKNVGGLAEDCYAHDIRNSSCTVGYHSYNATWRRCRLFPNHNTSSAWPANFECNTGTVLEDCEFGSTPSGRRITWSNGQHTNTWAGVTYSSVDGRLTIKNAKWTATGQVQGRLAIESWMNGIDGGTPTSQSTPPIVVDAAGKGLIYWWAPSSGGSMYYQSPDLP